MSNAGIRRFQGWLHHPGQVRDMVQAEAEVMLYHARDRAWVELDVQEFRQTRAFLWEVARRLAAEDPQVSTDPVMVKAREVAPELIRTEWCTAQLVAAVTQYVADNLVTGAVFAVYAEVGMDNGKLELDMGLARHQTAVEIARAACAAFAYRVFIAAADDDLEEDR